MLTSVISWSFLVNLCMFLERFSFIAETCKREQLLPFASSCGVICRHKNGQRMEHQGLLVNFANNLPYSGIVPVLAA